MATIASARSSSLPPRSPTSSTRSSISLDRPTAASTRRNRSALRDFYNLPSEPSSTSTSTPIPELSPEEPDESSALDAPGFSPAAHVETLLETGGLAAVLREEARLLGEVRGLDGERKALVYNNYSKLIAATETIGRMRGELEPMGPVLGRLDGMVGAVVEGAEGLAGEVGGTGQAAREGVAERLEDGSGAEVATVQWVLRTPQRLTAAVKDGRREEAEKDWVEVRALLDGWEGVGGVQEVREQCEAAVLPEGD